MTKTANVYHEAAKDNIWTRERCSELGNGENHAARRAIICSANLEPNDVTGRDS
jgi:hypothetical protein